MFSRIPNLRIFFVKIFLFPFFVLKNDCDMNLQYKMNKDKFLARIWQIYQSNNYFWTNLMSPILSHLGKFSFLMQISIDNPYGFCQKTNTY